VIFPFKFVFPASPARPHLPLLSADWRFTAATRSNPVSRHSSLRLAHGLRTPG